VELTALTSAAQGQTRGGFDGQGHLMMHGTPRFVLGVYDSGGGYSTDPAFWEDAIFSPAGPRGLQGFPLAERRHDGVARQRAGTTVMARRKNFARRGCLPYDVGVSRERHRSWQRSLLMFLAIVSLSGRLHIIWNGEPRFMLIDDHGSAIRLVIDEAVVRSFGGPQGLNQKRVTITGERVSDTPEVVQVSSIKIVTENN